MGEQRNRVVKSDERLFDIIQGLQDLQIAGVTELAAHLDMNKSSVHKHLKTLEKNDYVVNSSGTYRLSFKFLYHGGHVRHQNLLSRLAHRKVNEVADDTDQLVTFSVMEHGKGVIVYFRNDRYDLRETLHMGQRFHLHQNAAGKAMLAQLPDAKTREIIGEHGLPTATPNTIRDEDGLFEELDQIRQRGFSMAFEEQIEGAHAVSASASDLDGETTGAVTLYCPTGSLTNRETRERYASIVQNAVNELKLQIRHQ
jgi:DNA-binding IclR family transcriptional regulator